MQPVIETHNLTKRFGTFTAVDKVSFRANPGEVLGYLGPNGAGKTTTIHMLLGMILPSAGEAQVLGYDIVKEPEAIRERVGYMSQKFALYEELTAWENLRFYAGVYGVREHAHLQNTISRVGLTGLEKTPVADLPLGWKQRLALAIAIVHRPQLLFLDEPTSGVDPTARRDFWDLIYEIVADGVTALVTTHYMDEAEYCGRVGIMSRGRLLALDAPSALKREALPGLAWDVFAEPLLPSLNALEGLPDMQRVGLAGDHLRAITGRETRKADLKRALKDVATKSVRVNRVEPTLEDVFLALADAR